MPDYLTLQVPRPKIGPRFAGFRIKILAAICLSSILIFLTISHGSRKQFLRKGSLICMCKLLELVKLSFKVSFLVRLKLVLESKRHTSAAGRSTLGRHYVLRRDLSRP